MCEAFLEDSCRKPPSQGKSRHGALPNPILRQLVPQLVAVVAGYHDIRQVVGSAFTSGPNMIDRRLLEADPATAPVARQRHSQRAAVDYRPQAPLEPRVLALCGHLCTKPHEPAEGKPEGTLVCLRTAHGTDALAWMDRQGRTADPLKLDPGLPPMTAVYRLGFLLIHVPFCVVFAVFLAFSSVPFRVYI
jgi:hypothetical protein